ncbi:hypothetical protein U9608_001218 [Vibrio alginolyticus]|nr:MULTISPECIES: hypothetical protein [Vibrio]EMB9233722.1 hypothetical protein [Vibrio alginolyticus]EGS6497202.1 hypothetical protein [Vibrio parahaemolyticus]EHR0229278.1 hypothetical protein [Vibrio parahaemolyticus]ELF4876471.1 hypothetical protein [Vibrio parahaemolyticus]MCG9621695.1 hypothetical protein [Vibrio diabolicus]
MLNASKYAKSVGVSTLKEVAEKSGIPVTTLHEWAAMKSKVGAEGRRFAFEAVCEKVARDSRVEDASSLALEEYIDQRIQAAMKKATDK